MPVFCRHNRYTADCPICSKGTVLDSGRRAAPRRTGAPTSGRRRTDERAPAFSGPHSAAGPYEDEDDASYVVHLEKVPGGIRLAEWAGSQLRRRAPVLAAADLPGLLEGAAGVLPESDATTLSEALSDPGRLGIRHDAESLDRNPIGVSRGRSGDFKEELRAEDLGEGRIRIARWVLRPGSGWELQDAPVLVPAARLAEALRGVLAGR